MIIAKANAKENLGEFICLSITKANAKTNLQIFICNHFLCGWYYRWELLRSPGHLKECLHSKNASGCDCPPSIIELRCPLHARNSRPGSVIPSVLEAISNRMAPLMNEHYSQSQKTCHSTKKSQELLSLNMSSQFQQENSPELISYFNGEMSTGRFRRTPPGFRFGVSLHFLAVSRDKRTINFEVQKNP